MIVALIGSHGTGKTSVFNALRKKFPRHLYFSEAVRHQAAVFGYRSPQKLIGKIGVTAFELMNMNAWSVIDKKMNGYLKDSSVIITDRSAIDNYGYYLAGRKNREDFRSGKLLKNMAMHYAHLIDLFIYFPVGQVVLKKDAVRPGDRGYQMQVDKNIKKIMKDFGIPARKIHYLKSASVEDRVGEIGVIIKALKNKKKKK